MKNEEAKTKEQTKEGMVGSDNSKLKTQNSKLNVDTVDRPA